MAHVKTITTTLDSLPAGGGPGILENGKLKKAPLPEGVSKKALLRDIILIAASQPLQATQFIVSGASWRCCW